MNTLNKDTPSTPIACCLGKYFACYNQHTSVLYRIGHDICSASVQSQNSPERTKDEMATLPIETLKGNALHLTDVVP